MAESIDFIASNLEKAVKGGTDLNKAIVSGVVRREPSLDFLTAHAAGLRRMTDPEVLALAAEQQRNE